VPNGRLCKCGARGCLEAVASGTAIGEMTGQPAAHAPAHVIEQTGMYVGRAVASVAALLDLRLAVIGGSVALGFGEPFFRAAQTEADRYAAIEFARGIRLLPAGLGGDAPLVGAAAIARRQLA
ncbi:MAG: ROK family protein, partial [Ilumatobacteraceae bacterium]|nr:ROK family protein [Ilumatobacteraceae bacterium]